MYKLSMQQQEQNRNKNKIYFSTRLVLLNFTYNVVMTRVGIIFHLRSNIAIVWTTAFCHVEIALVINFVTALSVFFYIAIDNINIVCNVLRSILHIRVAADSIYCLVFFVIDVFTYIFVIKMNVIFFASQYREFICVS